MAGLDGIAPMRRDTLGERIFAELSEFLISGRLHPGERLSLRKMAEQMGVSMMPVRDAVGRLANEGALVVSPNRAVLVPLMTRARLVEMTEVRLAVEGFAARRAASHRTAGQLDAIRDLAEQFRALVQADEVDIPAALHANMMLHFAVYEASGLPTLVSMIRPLWLKVGPVLNLDFGAAERFSEAAAAAHHADLVEALASGDEAAAEAALVADIRAASDYIQARLPEQEDK